MSSGPFENVQFLKFGKDRNKLKLHARINKEQNKFAESLLLLCLESCVFPFVGGCRNIQIVIYLNTQKHKFFLLPCMSLKHGLIRHANMD